MHTQRSLGHRDRGLAFFMSCRLCWLQFKCLHKGLVRVAQKYLIELEHLLLVGALVIIGLRIYAAEL